MKKNYYVFLFLLLIPIILSSQNTSSLLVKAVEALPDEGTVIAQSVKIKNLELVNSDQLDYSPVSYKNGVLFTSNRTPKKTTIWNKIFRKKSPNLFFAEKVKDGIFKAPVAIESKMNGKMNEGAITVDRSGNLMIYAVNDKKSKNDYELVDLKLYSTIFENGKWSKGAVLPINCENCTSCHPSLSPDAKTLYFSSNRPGGYGGMDIYSSKFIDGQWSTPVNLGPKINTVENDVFPFINHDGTLYFSSNGKVGSDNLDIYFSQLDGNGEWNEATNIGQPFNSTADDFGFFIEKDGLSGLFSSNREGGKGKDDIYFWRMDQSLEQALDPTPVKFTIIDEETGDQLSNAKVSLIEFKNIQFKIEDHDSPMAFVGHINQTLEKLFGNPYSYQTDFKGNFYHDLKHDRNYLIIVEKEDYKTFRKITTYNLLSGIKDIDIAMVQPDIIKPEPQIKNIFDLAATEEIEEYPAENEINPLAVKAKNDNPEAAPKVAKKITLDHIYFEYNNAELKTESAYILDETAEILKDHPEMEINLVSHTDSRGNADYNKALSQQRADAARKYLILRGIEAHRVQAIGLGEEELLNNCADGKDCSEELHSQNRRTEIVITKYNSVNEIFVKKE